MAAQVSLYGLVLVFVCGCIFHVTGLSCNYCRNFVFDHSVTNIDLLREILNRMENSMCYNTEQEQVGDPGGFPESMERKQCHNPPTTSKQIYKCGVMEGKLQIDYDNRPISLNVFTRDCLLVDAAAEDTCYFRQGEPADKKYFTSELGSITYAVSIGDFVGKKCICSGDLCYAEKSSADILQTNLLISLILVIFLLFCRYF